MQLLLSIIEALVVATFPPCVFGGLSGIQLSVECWSVRPLVTSDRVAVVLRDALGLGDWAWVVV